MPGGLEVVVDLGAVDVRQLGYRFDLHEYPFRRTILAGLGSLAPGPRVTRHGTMIAGLRRPAPDRV